MEVQSAFAGAAAFGMGDAFHIDDLLDFSNEDIAGPIGEGLLSSLDSNVAGAETTVSTTGSAPLAGTKHLLDGEEPAADALCVPCDDLAELEWLSKFVEDSFSMEETPTRPVTSFGGHCLSTDLLESYADSKDPFQSASPVSVLENSSTSLGRAGNLCRELSIPGRARSKRSRTGGRVWGNSRILSSSSCATTDTESLSSDSNVVSGGQYSSPSSALSEDSHQHPIMLMTPPKAVTTMKKPWKPGKGGKKGQEGAQPWRCLHCATQRTPQWRAGPMGPKTLCNACGVRYKSGRLVPEYRPAGSPGYIGHKHSNSHKKILEMRRQKETGGAIQYSLLSSDTSSQVSSYSVGQHQVEETQVEDPGEICTSQNLNLVL